MAGLANSTPLSTELKLHQQSRVLEITYADGQTFSLPCEFLRVYSPSAEVRDVKRALNGSGYCGQPE